MRITILVLYGIIFLAVPLSVILAIICKKKKGKAFENVVPLIVFILQFIFLLIFLMIFLIYFLTGKTDEVFHTGNLCYFIVLFGIISVNLQIFHLIAKEEK